jgi:PAS domain S-box-containing protein
MPQSDWQSETRFRALFDHAAVGIALVAPDGRWLEANPGLCALLGFEREELLGRTVLEVTHPADREHVQAHLGKLLGSEAAAGLPIETRGLRKDGSPIWLEVNAVLVRTPSGAPDHFVGVVSDIGARKSAQAEAGRLRLELEERVASRTAELAEAVNGLESFSYSVSHDLRTPLRAISGFAQILARRHRASLEDEGRHYLDNIVRASAQMGRLIEDLLGYARLGRRLVKLEPIDLGGVIAEVLHDLEPRVKELGAELRLPEEPPVVLGDSTLLFQIFLNLIENALTYRHRDVRAQVAITCQLHDGYATVCVEDNGIGISPEHFDTIFGVFQRLHNQDEYPGTGIGLATVKRAAQMLQARVWVESIPGAGSRFFVRLRCCSQC